VIIVFGAIGGLLIGSFLTVVADRVPRHASIVAPGSACASCGLRLLPIDLVPVFSWLFLRGRCRRCRTAIGVEALLLELATATVFALLAWHFGLSWELGAYCAFAAGLIALSAVDLRTKRLPREITYVTGALGLPLLVVAALVRDEPRRIWMAVLGAVIALVIMLAVYLASRGGMGDGDVRLSPLIGAFLGWLNPGIVPIGLLFGFFAGAVVGVVLIGFGTAGRKTALPFGPFLALGAIVAVFAGQSVVGIVWRTHG
jgi:leader peptidase (prepilin peptidase)/N-methyltransferase